MNMSVNLETLPAMNAILWDAFGRLPVQSIHLEPVGKMINVGVRLKTKATLRFPTITAQAAFDSSLLECFMSAADRIAIEVESMPQGVLVWTGIIE